ncbi:GntR family transcriptional regulator [Mycolicibacterium madagascariense]|uniref:GntR family transcriptional regulator n=1 Tax=Mycolicibacterium madagascariense TaxID=212765 RepID=A0A7I7XD09_9MYCO|nr:GntR family transcriptional regulator [Mycolicibacterium madagascariense]MCV7015201.1 GntR family transcriptional regulator [Mycolicibacterium madagascariense]BBZ27494.1 GntR family transcriptional regulator [Mycolicibacterium madagascariense]
MLSNTPSLKRASLRDQALAVLREGMVSGELAPGEIYSVTALANQLGVSASPVREAMLTLVNQGLMEPIRNRGFRVLPIDDSDRREIFELRVLLEIPAMEKLAGNDAITAEYAKHAAVAAEIVDAARDGDLIDYLDADRRFHMGLLAHTTNERLLELVDGLRDQTRLFGLKELSDRGTLTASAEEHLPILDAIVAGDAEKTRTLMLRHLEHIKGDWGDAPLPPA